MGGTNVDLRNQGAKNFSLAVTYRIVPHSEQWSW